MNWLVLAVIFFILAIVAGALGFGLIAGVSYAIAKVLAAVFFILLIVSIIFYILRRGT
jgi:uncharacterized membrane protein YtjA (UPF0391 family)